MDGLDSTREELVSRLKAAHAQARDAEVGRCRLTLSNPSWNRLELSA